MSTRYHSKYFAHELTKRCSADSLEKLTGAVAGAQVDLNPHQVDAALFAFRSPLSKGALLADEVGLGKTVEAGLVLSQKWAEQKRRILIITPSNLRKQWHQEMTEKFFLPCEILETKAYNQEIKNGNLRPFESTNEIVICSYQFASNKASDVANVRWDLVVIDEAHRLRNVYKPSNVIANTLKVALNERPKILLTATPLQNSLLELFGLVGFIDEHTFGDLKSFREQFCNINQDQVFDRLRERLKTVCYRTLRRQVTQYISYTKRRALVQEFSPEESEDQLYDLVSDYLRRDNLYALPPGQRKLMTLVLRKLLASSTFAIAGALTSISERLKALLTNANTANLLEDEIGNDVDGLDETREEWDTERDVPKVLSESERAAIGLEISELDRFALLATSIEHNAKGKALLKALEIAFAEAKRLGAPQKAIIFTESRRTQDYLLRVLQGSPWNDGLVLFNGSNTDTRSNEIFGRWMERHRGTDKMSGSRSADKRSALVEYFRDEGGIMIATEAGAEGINLQFCSLVVNYDLPWNPQRIEQRIGRCHRYGQKHDVVVVNFLNRKNEADQRVFELLSEKFQLFEGVFGASDEVLGTIESGIDFEKRIADIYQRCRKSTEIKEAFDLLQMELGLEINTAMSRTRKQLLENFDETVLDKVRDTSLNYRNRFERQLMEVARAELDGFAEFLSDASFRLDRSPFGDSIPTGLYELPRRSGEAHLLHLNHPLAGAIIEQAKSHSLEGGHLRFDYGRRENKISPLEALVGQGGYLMLTLFAIEALDQREEHLIMSASTDSGTIIAEETAQRLFSLPAEVLLGETPTGVAESLEANTQYRRLEIEQKNAEKNAAIFEAEADKLEDWADDLKVGLEREIKDIDRQIKEARRSAVTALSLEEKLAGQRKIKALELQRSEKRRFLFEAQDRIDHQRGEMIAKLEGKLVQSSSSKILFSVKWSLA